MTMYIIKNPTGQFFQQYAPGDDYKPGDPLIPVFGNERSRAQLIEPDVLPKVEKFLKDQNIPYEVERSHKQFPR